MSFSASAVSPLEEARRSLGLTLDDIAAKLGCSAAAVSRYLSGSRTPPALLFLTLGCQDLEARQNEWLERTGRKRRRGQITLTVETRLRRGITEEDAKAACVAALSQLRARQVSR